MPMPMSAPSNSRTTDGDPQLRGDRYPGSVARCIAVGLFLTSCNKPSVAPEVHGPSSSPPQVIIGGITSSCPVATGTDPAPVIDNFEAGLGRGPAYGSGGRFWFNYDDGTGGQLVREVLTEGTQLLHVSSSGFTHWGAGFGTLLGTERPARCGTNAAAYAGIRFRARGQGRLRLMLASVSNSPPSEGGTCALPGQDCFDRPGVWVDLDEKWQTFEYPFCAFVPEGWGRQATPLEPEALLGLHFRIGVPSSIEFWMDDLAFFRSQEATQNKHCGAPCPLEAAPRTARVDPTFAATPLSPELTLNTFQQETPHCGALMRRYLSYVPKRLGPSFRGPVMILLHGSGANAEANRSFMTHERFDKLAARDGFVVVYGNSAPSAFSDPSPVLPNSGTWRQGSLDDGQVDDVDYLVRVLDDLKARQVISGDNPVYLTGISNGGGMVLAAARRAPQRFRGIAAVMPYDGAKPAPVPDLKGTRLERILFIYSEGDPGLPLGYTPVLASLPTLWATALGFPSEALAQARTVPLSNTIAEGDSYAGTNAVLLGTRRSQATQVDIAAPGIPGKLRVLKLDHAGHFWPNPAQDAEEWVLNRWGFRNQDFDAADAVWDFFRSAE